MATKLSDFVMTWQGSADADKPDSPVTKLAIHGPFETEDGAAEWGRLWQEGAGDDPRWQVVVLPESIEQLVITIERAEFNPAAAAA